MTWEVAEMSGLKNIVRQGRRATPQLGHSARRVGGLKSDRWYWYRFRRRRLSPIAARTARMGRDARAIAVRVCSCQHFETGLFTAYQHIAAEELDLVLHLGDYI